MGIHSFFVDLFIDQYMHEESRWMFELGFWSYLFVQFQPYITGCFAKEGST